MPTRSSAGHDELAREADAAVRQLYARHAGVLHGYVRRFCPDRSSADDIVQETFIRAWRHLPQLSADDRLVRAWLFRVARNLLTDADRARRSRPVLVQAEAAEEGGDDTKLTQVLDHQLVTGALQRLSLNHRTVLVETFYRGRTLTRVARQLGIPYGTARSRLHYALQALRQQLEDCEATGSG
jgi:RNA polymerase sigma-70 factor, ECF subfamily